MRRRYGFGGDWGVTRCQRVTEARTLRTAAVVVEVAVVEAASASRGVVAEVEVWAATWAELLVEVALAGAAEAWAVVSAARSGACSGALAVPERNGAERVAAAVWE